MEKIRGYTLVSMDFFQKIGKEVKKPANDMQAARDERMVWLRLWGTGAYIGHAVQIRFSGFITRLQGERFLEMGLGSGDIIALQTDFTQCEIGGDNVSPVFDFHIEAFDSRVESVGH